VPSGPWILGSYKGSGVERKSRQLARRTIRQLLGQNRGVIASTHNVWWRIMKRRWLGDDIHTCSAVDHRLVGVIALMHITSFFFCLQWSTMRRRRRRRKGREISEEEKMEEKEDLFCENCADIKCMYGIGERRHHLHFLLPFFSCRTQFSLFRDEPQSDEDVSLSLSVFLSFVHPSCAAWNVVAHPYPIRMRAWKKRKEEETRA
jgi:hypothetical protein